MIEIELQGMTAVELRKLAARYGIKGASKGRKADLIVPLATAMERERIEREAKANPASIDLNVSEHPTTDPEANAKITAATETPREEFQRLTSLPLSQQTKAIQKRIRQLSNLPENTGPREEAEATPAAQPEAKKGNCRSCGVRNIGTGSGDANDRDAAKAVQLCVPCHEEAQWENEHSDRSHDALPEDAAERAGCWICHPELNRASADYKGRCATSRAGMKMNVTRKMSSREKAELVAQQLTKSNIVQHKDGGVTLIGDSPAGKVELRFTARSFDYKASRVGGKKVLNVAAALRRIAEAN
ncbi:Rho termination factor N-terminal domain-containing protein [Micromonospora halotolerans]|uniref:Rho termination factor N-terminal domain-containing protein n=1 Tax=Micromonospora halotolerans TaxID=709879 RepID=A0ABY9ZQ08_9ACTN|nr:Rho termination factor N-terminal domain-containing protein [Micromonospora halotolerans]WNM37045.1 Rho termination factor N-terminal domain-containing protein [Micromonospora halotolerans]